MDQVTRASPTSESSPSASHTACDPSTMLLRHGGWPACALSQPLTESHWSTTFAVTFLPFPAVILIIFKHSELPLNHPVESATTRSVLLWNFSSHCDGSPPSPPSLKSFSVRIAGVEEVTGGEQRYWGYDFPPQFRVPEDWQLPPLGGGFGGIPPPQMWVPTSRSSLHLPLMQMSWPSQSLRVLHCPLHPIAFARRGKFMIRKVEAKNTRLAV